MQKRIAVFLLFLFLSLPYLFSEGSRVLVVRGDADYPPFEFLNDQGLPDGFNIDIFKSVAEVMNLEYEISLDTWQTVRTELEQGSIDMLLGMYKSADRDILVDFSLPHYMASYAVFVRKGSSIKSLEDASGRRISVQRDDIGNDYIRQQGVAGEIIAGSTVEEALRYLASGDADCAFVSRLQGLMIIREKAIRGLETVGPPLNQQRYCFAVREGDSELLYRLNEGLSIIESSGVYGKIYEKWFSIYEGPDYRGTLRIFILVLLPLLAVLLAVVGWNWLLKKQVSRRTEELRQSREDLRITLDSIGDAVLTTDIAGRITGMNPVAERLTGWPLAEAEGRLLDEIFIVTDAATGNILENPVEKAVSRADVVYLPGRTILSSRSGDEYRISDSVAPIKTGTGEVVGAVLIFRDISEEFRMQEALEKKLIALTLPLENADSLRFEDIFNMENIKNLQIQFSEATGLASLIKRPDGSRLTEPVGFYGFCSDIVRKNEYGGRLCEASDENLPLKEEGYSIGRCGSAGLWDASIPIVVEGHHLATWFLGQARDPSHKPEEIRAFARKIGVDPESAVEEFLKLPIMDGPRVEAVTRMMRTISIYLADMACQNLQQTRIIRERNESEKELKQLRNYLRNIIDSMPSMIIGIDPLGRVIQLNRTAEEATGRASADACGMDFLEVVPWLADKAERIRFSIRSGEVETMRHVRQGEGPLEYEEVTVYPLSGGVEGAVVRIDNVTSRLRMEEMMIQNEKMLSVGGLAAGMAHEINNPLAGLLQTANVMSSRLAGGADIPANTSAAEELGVDINAIVSYMQIRDIPRMINTINESGKRIAAIVENMLNFARKSDYTAASCRMDELIDRTIELAATDYDLKKHYDFKKIRIERKYQNDIPSVFCEAGKIQQVLLNLFRNAAQAMHSAGVPEPAITVSAVTEDGWMIVSVRDNGPGMDEPTRRRIFEPFFTTKPAGSGTGLGLSVSYFIIKDNHKGEMSVESQPGQGACFIIRLPLDGGVHEVSASG